MYQTASGYQRIESSDSYLFVHHLVAILGGADPYEVFDEDTVVHHDNDIPWYNVPDNVSVMSRSDHAKHHARERDWDSYYDNTGKPWWDEDLMRELYHDRGLTMEEISDKLGVSQPTVDRQLQIFGIETRSVGRTKPKPWKDEEQVIDVYINSDKTQKEAADELGCTPQTLRKWLKRHDIGYRPS